MPPTLRSGRLEPAVLAPRRAAALAALSLASWSPHLGAQDREPIVIDGSFDDWVGAVTAVNDPADALDAEVDFREVLVDHDDGALYLLIDFGHPINPQALDGTVTIVIDADGDPASGSTLDGLSGADMAVDLSPPYTVGRGPPRVGVGVRFPADGAGWAEPRRTDSYEIGLMFAPATRSRLAELRFDRAATGREVPSLLIGDSVRVKLLYGDASGRIRDETPAFSYPLEEGRPRPAQATGDPLARAPATTFRVLAWNVSRGNLLTRSDRFRRVLAAVRPDVVLLDEAPATGSAAAVMDLLPSGAGDAGWQVLYGEGGGRQRGVVGVRGVLRPMPSLLRIPYPAQLEQILARDGHAELPSGFPGMDADIAALGARVELAGKPLLVVTLDLQCCGNGPNTTEDRLRRVEAGAIHSAARTALESRAGPVDGLIIAGDFNLVGSDRPLRIMRAGLDLDGEDLSVVEPLQLDGLSNATWSSAGDAFSPGRLDFMLYSGSTLAPTWAFVLDTRDLAPEWLTRHGLRADDTGVASSHAPLVVDFRWIE